MHLILWLSLQQQGHWVSLHLPITSLCPGFSHSLGLPPLLLPFDCCLAHSNLHGNVRMLFVSHPEKSEEKEREKMKGTHPYTSVVSLEVDLSSVVLVVSYCSHGEEISTTLAEQGSS